MKRFMVPMLTGHKTLTSRTKRYGKSGDTFDAFGATFRLLDVSKMQLDEVGRRWYDEGFESFTSFVLCWKGLHPRKGYDPEQWVWAHLFEKVEKGATRGKQPESALGGDKE